MFVGNESLSRQTHASSRTELKALAAEQIAALGQYRDRWLAVRRATQPADRSAAEAGVRLAYRAAGLEPPRRVIWSRGPIELADLTREVLPTDGPDLRSKVIDGVRHRVASDIKRRVSKSVRASVANAINLSDALSTAATEAVIRSTRSRRPSFAMRIRHPFSAWANGRRRSAVGLEDLAWLGVYEYFHDTCELKVETAPLRGLWLLANNVGWILPCERVCWLAERHNILRSDLKGRLHSANGPALRYPDGWSLYAWKSVVVPAWVIEQSEKITLRAIDNEPDVQIRRCMIEIMTPERFVAEGGTVCVGQDETGILWQKTWWGFDAWSAVEVVNGTPGPDGNRKHYFLQVPAGMRTPRQAVAWTYGLTEQQYTRLKFRT